MNPLCGCYESLRPFLKSCPKCACRCCHACISRQRGDARDRYLPVPPRAAHIPTRFVLEHLPPAPDQANISACAVNACATALNVGVARAGVQGYAASRLFLYYNTRRYIMHQDVDVDVGCSLRDVCKAACKFGVCDEGMWPYDKKLLAVQPPKEAYEAAARMPRCTYHAVAQTLHGLLSCLLHYHVPIMMGISVFRSMSKVLADGYLPLPGPRDKPIGAHAVLLCGFDLWKSRFIMQNCWGAEWGNNGYFEVSMQFVLDPGRCWDLWALLPTPAH